MYEKVIPSVEAARLSAEGKARPPVRRDWKLIGCVSLVVLLALLLLVPLVYSMSTLYRFHRFAQDLAVSFVYGEDHETLTVSSGGESRPVEKRQAENLYGLLMDTGMGRPCRPSPDGDGLALDFGKGSLLEISPTEITARGRTNDTGIRVQYTRPDGSVFAYTTDRLQYEDVVRALGGF